MSEQHRPDEVQEPIAAPRASTVALAFAAIYLIWGSTYLAIRVAVQTIEPLTMAGLRFAVAGAGLYAFNRLVGDPRPTLAEWRAAAIVGGLMLLGGNGAVVWAETRVASGVAALIIATVPLWMVTLDAALRRARPRAGEVAGLVLGFAGVWVLIDPGVGRGVDPFGAGLLLFASASWAVGSLYSRVAGLAASPREATAMQMLAGGALLLVAGGLKGEWPTIDPARFSAASLVALGYLTVFGSLVAFSAYVWLLRVSTPARVSTYAYVNPVVAVLLGWLILDEPLTPDTFLASGLIVTAVLLTARGRLRRSRRSA